MLQVQIEEDEIEREELNPIRGISIPQSAKRIFEILSRDGPLTSGDLEERCAYSDRTIRNALKRLIRIGLVRKVANFNDMRTSLFHALNPNAA
ncbi:MAG: MarR family transcriptional regulator [Candidatus Hodarchaeota archaeon]